jgi:putative Mg2+ transporter-C (MgtC) family protein
MADLVWYEVVGRILAAAAMGGALGLGREFDGQDAGFRTHLLVVVGSALFGIVSVAGFDEFVAPRSDTNITIDITRIAAYVAPGIGFIGGGAILKYGGRVAGITTAASLWVAAAIGVAVGVGFWVAGVVATVVAMIALEVLKPVTKYVNRLGRRRRAALSVILDAGADLTEVLDALGDATHHDLREEIRELRYGIGPDDSGELTVELWRHTPDRELAAVISRVAAVPGVRTVQRAANV